MGYHVLSDMVVKLYDLHLGSWTDDQIKELLKEELAPAALPYQLFNNLKAYARGLDDFRHHLDQGVGLTGQEPAMRDWLQMKAPWALTERIDVRDVATWGRWAKAMANFVAASLMDPNPHPSSSPPQSAPAEVPPSGAQEKDPQVAFLKSVLGPLGLAGSNSMAWSFGPVMKQGVRYAGCLGDQQGANQLHVLYPDGTGEDEAEGTIFYAHLDVDPPNPLDPGYSSFGFLRHGAGTFFISHNENVAYGGSAAGANIADAFLLRLQQNADGTIAEPLSYYSYYLDDYVALVADSVTIDRLDGGPFPVPVLRAGEFGLVFNTTPFYADNTTTWGTKNSFYSADHPSDPTARIPVLVSYRCPHDKDVHDVSGSDDHHSRLAAAAYRFMRSRDVFDVRPAFENQDVGYTVDFCAVDRDGRMFATLAGSVPQRGDDLALLADGWDSVSKFSIYDADGEPVPARWLSDQRFDWQLTGAGNPKYLVAAETGDSTTYLPYVFFNPLGSDDEPAEVAYTPGQNDYENPGFLTASNDQVWHFYKKRYDQVDLSNPVAPAVADNAILDRVLKSWTLYHVWGYSFTLEALEKNQQMIDTFLEIAETGNTLDLEGAKDFTVSKRLYVAEDYQSWDENTQQYVPPADATLQTLPATIRVLQELRNNLPALEQEADRESQFFKDLWEALWSPQGLTHLKQVSPSIVAQVNLKSIWIDGIGSTFYYPEDLYPGAGFQNRAYNFAMPQGGALVDFLWRQTWLSAGQEPRAADGSVSLDAGEEASLASKLDQLIQWDGPVAYERSAGSTSALLFEQFKQGFSANNYAHARRWVPVLDGAVMSSPVPYDDASFGSQPRHTLALVAGALPDPLVGDDQFLAPTQPYDGEYLVNAPLPWEDFKSMAFPPFTWSSMWLPSGAGLHPIANHPEISQEVYDSLYLPSGSVKQVLCKTDVNQLVKFLLELGGFWSESGASDPSLAAPSTKLVPFDNWLASWDSSKPLPPPHAKGYPLTRNMIRVALLRRLLDAGDFITNHGLGTYGEVIKVRAYAYDDQQKWPLVGGLPDPAGAPSEGYGFAGAVPFPDLEQSFSDPAYTLNKFLFQKGEGFAQRFWAKPVSTWPLLTFFPENGRPAQSFFWVAPGNRIMAFDSLHYAAGMQAIADNELMTTHFNDYLRPHVWSTEPGIDAPIQHCYSP
jgi:hypothetical protein